jgi:hypothetical protein
MTKRKYRYIIFTMAILFAAGCGTTNQTAPTKPASSSAAPQTGSAAVSHTPAAPAESPYYSGNGGKGLSLAILVPEGKGLTAEQNYLPSLVQGVFVGDFSK